MKRVEDKEASSGEEDKQALREATSNQLPNVALLRARLLFDGGYYDRALHELLDRNLKKIIQSSKDIPEYHYRLGRIYQEKGEDEKALSYFDKAIGEGKRLPYYLAANAALQSGLIYEEKKDLANAEKYFRLCLEMDYPDYKTSIDLKARAGLQRLNKK
jgi:tetratricopeptide (TPR) repeat protein